MTTYYGLHILLFSTMVCVTLTVPYDIMNGGQFPGMNFNFPTFESAFAKIDAKAPTPIGFHDLGPVPEARKESQETNGRSGFPDTYVDFFKDLEPSVKFDIPGFNVGAMKTPFNFPESQYNVMPYGYDSDQQPRVYDNQRYEQPQMQDVYDTNLQYPRKSFVPVYDQGMQGDSQMAYAQNRDSIVPEAYENQYNGNAGDSVRNTNLGSSSDIKAPSVREIHKSAYPDRSQSTGLKQTRFPVVLPLVKQDTMNANTGIGTYGEGPSAKNLLPQKHPNQDTPISISSPSKPYPSQKGNDQEASPNTPDILQNIPGANLASVQRTLNGPAYASNAVSGAAKEGATKSRVPPYVNQDKNVNKCGIEFFFDFDDKYPFTERHNRIWMGKYGDVYPENDSMVFVGNGGYLYLPYFSGNDLRPAYYISLRVYPQPSGSPGQAIFSNGYTSGSSTLSLALVGNKVELVVLQGEDYQNTHKVIVLSLPIETGSFSAVSVEQDGVSVRLTVGYESVHEYARLPEVSNEPLYIGLGSSSLGVLDPFTGRIDSLVFHKCPMKIKY